MKSIEKFLSFPLISHGIFWSWNSVFVVLLLFIETESGIFFNMIRNAFLGASPLDFALFSFLIIIIPPLSIVFGLISWRNGRSVLLKFFYGVEVPLLLLFILRISVFRQLSLATGFIFLAIFLGIAAYFLCLLNHRNIKTKFVLYFKAIGLSLLFCLGLYMAIIVLFYSIPFASYFLTELVSLEWLGLLKEGFWFLLFGFFFLLTSSLFIFLPIGMLFLYLKEPLHFFQTSKMGKSKILMISSLAMTIILLVLLNGKQVQVYAFEFFDQGINSLEQREQFHKKKDGLKEGLLNAYLSPYRYLSSQNSSKSIAKLYEDSFNMKPESAQNIQDVFNFFMSPFLYEGDFNQDQEKAKTLYEEYFDADLQELESKEIIAAMKCTWDADGIEAGGLNINQEKVLIKEQHIRSVEREDIVEIEVHEIYQNQTFERQEIFYYFELPENAVLTGLWLSDEDNIAKKYKYRVSPRGAAQEVYKSEVQRRVDPSLLEQVGPNQFRLRAFPILAKSLHSRSRQSKVVPGENFHLWFSYKAFSKQGNEWPAPLLLEKRNVYWDKNSKVYINGIEQSGTKSSWIPIINSQNPSVLKAHKTAINDSLMLGVKPFELNQELSLSNTKIALLVDASFSMWNHQNKLIQSLEKIEKMGFLSENIQLYLINDSLQSVDFKEFNSEYIKNHQAFFGQSSILEMVYLAKDHLVNSDLCLLISDKGQYQRERDELQELPLNIPLYLFHLDQKPALYQDALLETLKWSSGATLNEIEDLKTQLAFKEIQKKDSSMISFDNGLLYYLEEARNAKTDPNFEELAFGKYISKLKPKDSTKIASLDILHQLALKAEIVSPYSSMIVLVNTRQHLALNAAEASDERFDREVESGNENISKPNDLFNVTGTPEPHEWILLFLVFGFLAFHYWKKRMAVNMGNGS